MTVRVTGSVTQTYGELHAPTIDLLTSTDHVLGSTHGQYDSNTWVLSFGMGRKSRD